MEPTTIQPTTCASCGAALPPSAEWCGRCLARVEDKGGSSPAGPWSRTWPAQSEPAPAPPPARVSRRPNAVVIAAVIGVIALAGGAVALGLRSSPRLGPAVLGSYVRIDTPETHKIVSDARKSVAKRGFTRPVAAVYGDSAASPAFLFEAGRASGEVDAGRLTAGLTEAAQLAQGTIQPFTQAVGPVTYQCAAVQGSSGPTGFCGWTHDHTVGLGMAIGSLDADQLVALTDQARAFVEGPGA